MNVWIFQTGEPLHIDGTNPRPMRAMNLSNALVEAGHNVVLWSSAFYHQEKRYRSHSAKKIEVSDHLEIRLIPSIGYKRHVGIERLIDHAQLAINLKKMLKQEDKVPDVAFVGFPPIETAAVLIRWLKQRNVPTLLDVKDQWPSIFLNIIPKGLRPLARIVLAPYFYLARRAMADATGLSAMAQGFLDWALGSAGREQAQMDRVIPLTSPGGQICTAEQEEAQRWWDRQRVPDDGRFRVCFVGSLSPAFDFGPVSEASKQCIHGESQCEFIICGAGKCAPDVQTMLSGLPNVCFPGWIDRPKIEVLAERCKGALAPYLNIDNFTSNLPNKIIDSLSLGLPILSPLQGEVAKLITEHKVGLRYGTDTGKTLYDCIKLLMNDDTLQQNMSKNARRLYEECFSFEKVYGGLVEPLEMMADKSRIKNINASRQAN